MSSPGNEEHGNNQGHTPATTVISGFSRVYSDQRDDENLPEVYVDDTPQAIPKEYHHPHAAGNFDEAQSPKFSVAYDDGPRTALPPDDEAPGGEQPSKDQRICGIGRKTFFIILAIALIIVAAAVGGGVGGAVASSASKSGSSGEGDNSEDGGDPPPTSTSESTAVESTSSTMTASETASEQPSPTPEFLNNQTIYTDTFAFQGFSDTDYNGNATEIFTEEDGLNFDFGIASYVWAPQNTGCCLTYCMNATDSGMVGWGCTPRKQPKSSDRFRRIFIWCGEKHSEQNAICSD